MNRSILLVLAFTLAAPVAAAQHAASGGPMGVAPDMNLARRAAAVSAAEMAAGQLATQILHLLLRGNAIQRESIDMRRAPPKPVVVHPQIASQGDG